MQLGWRGRCSHGAVFPTEACSELVQKTDVIFLQNNAMNKVFKKNTHKKHNSTPYGPVESSLTFKPRTFPFPLGKRFGSRVTPALAWHSLHTQVLRATLPRLILESPPAAFHLRSCTICPDFPSGDQSLFSRVASEIGNIQACGIFLGFQTNVWMREGCWVPYLA